MSQPVQPSKPKRRRFAAAVIGAGILGTAALSLSMTGTLSAFTSAITNTSNTVASGAVVLQETNVDGSVVCTATAATGSANCGTINKYGGDLGLVPGGKSTPVTVKFKNLGSASAKTFTAAFGACTQSANGSYQGGANDLCSKLTVAVYAGDNATGTPVISSTAAALASAPASALTVPVAGGGTAVDYTFQVTLDPNAGNTYQGYQAAQPITWTLSS